MHITGKHIVFLLLLFFGCFLNAQEYSTKIEGHIFSKEGDVAAIHVSNISQNRGTITDAAGYFDISVKLNDTLVFSAVQFKRKQVVVTIAILKSKQLQIPLERSLTELNEVVVMPYNLSGDINRDMDRLETGRIITAATEKLPNSQVLFPTQTERKLFAATDWGCKCVGVKLDPLFNYFSGRTKLLNKRAARDAQEDVTNKVRDYYADVLYVVHLKIPKNKIDDFIFFSERDSSFKSIAVANDKLKLWEFFQSKSIAYRNLNNLD